MTLQIIVVIVLAALIYVRFAPSDPTRWHKPARPGGLGEKVRKKDYVWREAATEGSAARLAELDAIAMATPRTTRLAGSVEDRLVTYVTRSRLIGFPDYTTVGIHDGLIDGAEQRYLEINARLRFGRSDLGVNARRVKGWLAALKG